MELGVNQNRPGSSTYAELYFTSTPPRLFSFPSFLSLSLCFSLPPPLSLSVSPLYFSLSFSFSLFVSLSVYQSLSISKTLSIFYKLYYNNGTVYDFMCFLVFLSNKLTKRRIKYSANLLHHRWDIPSQKSERYSHNSHTRGCRLK